MKRAWKITLITLGAIIAAELCILIAGFLAVRFQWTNVAGEADPNSNLYAAEFNSSASTQEGFPNSLPMNGSVYGPNEAAQWCKIDAAADKSPFNAARILAAFQESKSDTLLRRMLFALSLRLPDREAFAARLAACETSPATVSLAAITGRLKDASGKNLYAWQEYEPWHIIRQGLVKDKATIYKAAEQAGVQPRLLVSVAIVEQLRLYYTQRELFEKVFKPLEILANANKMAWGVMSIKENMAIATEKHLTDTASPYFLGPEMSHLLDYPAGTNISRERYNRLTRERDHFYSYLYGGLIIRQFEAQWERAGFPISYRPEVVATLFNIGFNNSEPKATPAVGGSTITIEGKKYYFGSLAYEFYYSGDMMDEFPYK